LGLGVGNPAQHGAHCMQESKKLVHVDLSGVELGSMKIKELPRPEV
jgi:hypothetical protein